MDFELKQLDISNIDMIKYFFADVFTNEPWNDDGVMRNNYIATLWI